MRLMACSVRACFRYEVKIQRRSARSKNSTVSRTSSLAPRPAECEEETVIIVTKEQRALCSPTSCHQNALGLLELDKEAGMIPAWVVHVRKATP